ncbi:MAG: hypothetical protein ACRCW0_08040 [Clostridium sp.]
MNIRRVNLSFNLDDEDDKEVYDTISKQRFKTNFVCKAVLKYISFIDRDKEVITKKELKNTLIEVLKELDISKIGNLDVRNTEEDELPKEVFDMFTQL